MDTLRAKHPGGVFDLIFADPPYFLSNGNKPDLRVRRAAEMHIGLLAVEIAVNLPAGLKHTLGAVLFAVALVFVDRSFYGRRIPVDEAKGAKSFNQWSALTPTRFPRLSPGRGFIRGLFVCRAGLDNLAPKKTTICATLPCISRVSSRHLLQRCSSPTQTTPSFRPRRSRRIC